MRMLSANGAGPNAKSAGAKNGLPGKVWLVQWCGVVV